MKKTWFIVKRELASYFNSPIAYVFLIIFLLLSGFFTFMMGGFFRSDEASLIRFFVWHPWLYMLLVPAIGMRLWAEERRMGTLELLCTLPLSASQAIMGKFLAGWIFLGIALLLTLPMPMTVCYLGDPDMGPILTGYIGSFLMSGAYLAISGMTSACTRNQVISFITSVVVCLLLVLVGFPPVTNLLLKWGASSNLVDFAAHLSVMFHFESMQRGVLDLRDVVYFVSLIGFALFSTNIVLKQHRS
ncbi:MAG: ABC transporter permease [Lentisphaerae bacterium]|jgi:ABC-2 type transport system permease protein|nr:ABC transporter permease [Lentisphaerota bacterium]